MFEVFGHPSVYVSVHEHISGTTYPIVTRFSEHVIRSSMVLWRRCDILSICGFHHDVMFPIMARWLPRRHVDTVAATPLQRSAG